MGSVECAVCVTKVREGCGLFDLPTRGVIEVRGGDRERWLNGMVTNDVRGLAANPSRSCYATLLTAKGVILTDLWIFARPDCFWLEVESRHIAELLTHLGKYIIADDVQLADISGQLDRFALEGPTTVALVGEVVGREIEVAAGEVCELSIAGVELQGLAASYSGESAMQLFVPKQDAKRVLDALREAGRAFDLVEGDAACLETLRIEAGTPDLEAELLPDVFPQEARLQRAISTQKGCYIGQEIVARLESRGRVNHLLVGLCLGEGSTPPTAGEEIHFEEKAVGEVTSSARSPRVGAIAMGYVRADQAALGTEVRIADQSARVVSLPFFELAQPRE